MKNHNEIGTEERRRRKMSEYKHFHFYLLIVQGYLKKELTEAVLSVNAQDVNVPDPPSPIITAPPCCFKIEQRMKENRFKTDLYLGNNQHLFCSLILHFVQFNYGAPYLMLTIVEIKGSLPIFV